MDLHWRRERMRKWFALGERLGLTQKQIALQAKVSTRTVRRWCKAVRAMQGDESQAALDYATRDFSERLGERGELERAFVELLDPPRELPNPIQISLAGERRRLLVDGSVDVEALTRVITAVERC